MTQCSAPVAITTIVVDNHPTIRGGVELLAMKSPSTFALVGSYDTTDEIDLSGPPVDVVLLDLWLGHEDTLSTPWISKLRAWGARILIHTSEERPAQLRLAMQQGANGVVLKTDPPECVRDGILEVVSSGYYVSSSLAQALLEDPRLMANLSAREIEVLRCIDDGLSHKQIARKLGIAPSTVKTHLKKACQRFEEIGIEITNAIGAVKQSRLQGDFRSTDT